MPDPRSQIYLPVFFFEETRGFTFTVISMTMTKWSWCEAKNQDSFSSMQITNYMTPFTKRSFLSLISLQQFVINQLMMYIWGLLRDSQLSTLGLFGYLKQMLPCLLCSLLLSLLHLSSPSWRWLSIFYIPFEFQNQFIRFHQNATEFYYNALYLSVWEGLTSIQHDEERDFCLLLEELVWGLFHHRRSRRFQASCSK